MLSRHIKPDYDGDVNNAPRTAQTLQLFNERRLLPANVMHALIPNPGAYQGAYVKLLKRLWWAGLLDRRLFLGRKCNNETYTYSRTPAGAAWLERKGYPVYSDHNTALDEEQTIIDTHSAFIELGARKAGITLGTWNQIISGIPDLPDHPLRFQTDTGTIIPDGHGSFLKKDGNAIFFLDEVVRTNNKRKTLRYKIHWYRLLEQTIKTRFQFKAFMLRWMVTDDATKENILELIQEEFPNGCKWMLVKTITDHIRDGLSTVPVTTTDFDDPWDRVGYFPFSLKTLSEV